MGSERVHRRRWNVAMVALAVLAVAIVGIVASRLSGTQDTPTVSGPPKDAVATVMEFETALSNRDWAGICNRLYTAQARASAGGARCTATLAQSAGGLRDPRVRIISVTIGGKGATVQVAASVNGQRPVTDTITLAREGGRFKIASAGGEQ